RKLAKAGVRGLHGGPGDIAANRRATLVEYCLTSRIVTAPDPPDLDRPRPADPAVDVHLDDDLPRAARVPGGRAGRARPAGRRRRHPLPSAAARGRHGAPRSIRPLTVDLAPHRTRHRPGRRTGAGAGQPTAPPWAYTATTARSSSSTTRSAC